MNNTPELRQRTATKLLEMAPRVGQMSTFIGLDGFVDEIFHVVDKRESATKYTRLPTISLMAERFAAAAGKSTNIELVSQMVKLGGNGPIMGNALASLGLKVSYLGNLGYPNLHPVFADFAKRAEVVTIAEPGYTDALEFEDGKIMVGKHQSLKEVTWENIKARYGIDKFKQKFSTADLIGFVNWTMLTYTSQIWEAVLKEICPGLSGPRRKMFMDLADPEKRTNEDISKALGLITRFEKYFDVILGLNQKESHEIGRVMGMDTSDASPEGLIKLCKTIHQELKINTLVVHPTAFALATGPDGSYMVEGPFTPKPKITTGAGDHFNSGFCLGRMLGLPTQECLLSGVSTSGYYVRTGESPSVEALAGLMQNWPAES